MNSRLKTLLFASLLSIVPIFTLIIYKVAAYNQKPTLITLKSSGGVVEIPGPISSIFSSNDGQTVYLINGITGEVEPYSSETNKPSHSPIETSGPIAMNSNGYTALVDKNFKIAVLDTAGNLSAEFSTYTASSLAFLSNGNIIVASPTKKHFLHVYSQTGRLVKSFGVIKEYDKINDVQNQFLHKGKVLVDASDNIYYVFHYVPLLQKFSSNGELEYEVEVKGDAIDLQQDVAQRFFSIKSANQVGGIGIINSAAIDYETGHLWICMNGSSLTGVVYEYSSEGEKLREYALQVNSSFTPPQNIVGVNDIAITKSKLYALTSQNQVYSFDRNNGKSIRISRSNLTRQWLSFSFTSAMQFLAST